MIPMMNKYLMKLIIIMMYILLDSVLFDPQKINYLNIKKLHEKFGFFF